MAPTGERRVTVRRGPSGSRGGCGAFALTLLGYNTAVTDRALGVRHRFDPHPSSVGEARRLVRRELGRAGRPDLVECAELVVTEVVTNALVHAGTPIDVAVRIDGDTLVVEVADGSAQQPVVRHHGALAGTGRGLRLLQGMVDRWGSRPHDDGKTVWFELSRGDREGEWAAAPDIGFGDLDLAELDLDGLGLDGLDLDGLPDPAAETVVPADGETDTVRVELRNVPLLLHLAWHQHAEALLREHLLVGLGEETAAEDLQAHAAASDALSLLLEHLPTPRTSDDPDQLLATAVEPDVSSDSEVLPVPVGSVAHFRVLGETLDAALGLAEAGELLTPPTQPEIRAFRRWICREVEEQSRGAGATAWTDQSEMAPPSARSALGWSREEVRSSEHAVIAADDTNGIIAISGPAVALLGYDDAAQLVGRRLLAIIPNRLRQAHLAGFTLHLTLGRSPLLGRPVVVPALRRDGTEVAVSMTIDAEQLEGGRHVFVATMETAPAA